MLLAIAVKQRARPARFTAASIVDSQPSSMTDSRFASGPVEPSGIQLATRCRETGPGDRHDFSERPGTDLQSPRVGPRCQVDTRPDFGRIGETDRGVAGARQPARAAHLTTASDPFFLTHTMSRCASAP